MIAHSVRVRPSSDRLAREDQLAWALALVAADPTPVDDDVADMVVNRVIDDMAVAAASLARPSVTAARAQALSHLPSRGGAGSHATTPSDSRHPSPSID